MSDDGRWDECPSGLLAGMAADLRAQRRRARARPLIALAGAVLVAVIGYSSIAGLAGGSSPLNCKETAPLLAEYNQGKLTPTKSVRVAEHLAHCPSCRERYQEEFPEEVRRQQQTDHLALLAWGHLSLAAR